MLTIKLDPRAFAHRTEIVEFLENEVRELALHIEYRIVEADFNSVDFSKDEIFAARVFDALVRAVDKTGGV